MNKEDSELLNKFRSADFSNFPSFNNYTKTLERGLWVLWVAKDELKIKKVTAEQIALVLREIMEVSVEPKSIINAFNRAKDKKIHVFKNGETSFEIMKPGKEYLSSKIKTNITTVFYFEPGKKYTNKQILSEKVLSNLRGDLKIVDPYCGKRTLDILSNINGNKIKLLTNIKTLNKKKNAFIREYRDFITEYPNIEIRDYSKGDIHDRYIISLDSLVLIGYSIKDFGKKETFAVILKNNNDIREQLSHNFNDKWNNSNSII